MEFKEEKSRTNPNSSEETLSIPAYWQKMRLEEVEDRVSKKRRIEVEEPRGKQKLIALMRRMERENGSD